MLARFSCTLPRIAELSLVLTLPAWYLKLVSRSRHAIVQEMTGL